MCLFLSDVHYRPLSQHLRVVCSFQEILIYAQQERRPSTDEIFSDSSKTGGRKQSDAASSSGQLLRYQQEEPVVMPGGPTVRCVVQLLDGSDFETHVDVGTADDT